MSRRQVRLAPGYLLHHRAYRESGRILEVYTRDHGRLSLFARGVRGPRARLAGILQPFQLLMLSWSGSGEAGQLTGAELAANPVPLPAERIYAGFYLSELVMKLTARHDPLPPMFEAYHETLERLRGPGALEPALRIFEKRLLAALGFGLDLALGAAGEPIRPDGYYHFRPAVGLLPAVRGERGAIAGSSLLQLEAGEFTGARELEDARRLLQAAIGECLEGRALATRGVARAVARRGGGRMQRTGAGAERTGGGADEGRSCTQDPLHSE